MQPGCCGVVGPGPSATLDNRHAGACNETHYSRVSTVRRVATLRGDDPRRGSATLPLPSSSTASVCAVPVLSTIVNGYSNGKLRSLPRNDARRRSGVGLSANDSSDLRRHVLVGCLRSPEPLREAEEIRAYVAAVRDGKPRSTILSAQLDFNSGRTGHSARPIESIPCSLAASGTVQDDA